MVTAADLSEQRKNFLNRKSCLMESGVQAHNPGSRRVFRFPAEKEERREDHEQKEVPHFPNSVRSVGTRENNLSPPKSSRG